MVPVINGRPICPQRNPPAFLPFITTFASRALLANLFLSLTMFQYRDLVPGYPDSGQDVPNELGSIVNNSVAADFYQWGFVILRGVYDDDVEWEKFINLYKRKLLDELEMFGVQNVFSQHLQFTVIEDRAALEGASKDAVRARFIQWVEEQRAGELADKPKAFTFHPRFKYCLYMDEVCMKTITARQPSLREGEALWYLSIESRSIIIHGLHGPVEINEDDEEDEGYPELDGTTNYDVGWTYISFYGLVQLYANLSSAGSPDELWIGMIYRARRPERDPEPDYRNGRPLRDVPRDLVYRNGEETPK